MYVYHAKSGYAHVLQRVASVMELIQVLQEKFANKSVDKRETK